MDTASSGMDEGCGAEHLVHEVRVESDPPTLAPSVVAATCATDDGSSPGFDCASTAAEGAKTARGKRAGVKKSTQRQCQPVAQRSAMTAS